MSKGIILSVDDDESIQLVLGNYLTEDGYTFVTAGDGAQLKSVLQNIAPTVILLDLKLPDTDGVNLIQSIRQQCSSPIIILSGTTDTMEKVVCLELGADDYLTKPVELRELSARIKALLRRAESGNSNQSAVVTPKTRPPLAFGTFQLDCNRFELFDSNGQAVGITIGEFQLLEALAQAPNRVLSRDFLYGITRGESYESYDRAVDIQVGRLRKKLGDAGKNLIKTVRGVGYMFTPPNP